jgi:hypothetical protein
MKKTLMWIGISFGAFFLVVLTILIVDISNDDTAAKDISCEDVSLEEDMKCIFNQAFSELKLKENAVTDHYFVEKYNQTSIEVRVKNEVGHQDIFPQMKKAMKVASEEKDLKEFTVEFINGKGDIVDGYSFIGEDSLKDYNWDEVEWNEVSILAPKN